jgi:hypothetical protein
MQKIVALVLLFIAVGFPAFTKENPAIEGLGSLTGRVVDEKGYVLPGATVIIEGTDIGTVSDVNGFFRLSGLKDGAYRIQVSYIVILLLKERLPFPATGLFPWIMLC